jgi:hypothetical protein
LSFPFLSIETMAHVSRSTPASLHFPGLERTTILMEPAIVAGVA